MHDLKSKARLESLMELINEMEEMEKDEMDELDEDIMPLKKKLKKVTVMAPDEEGLKQGLSKAEKLLKKFKNSDE